MSTTSTISIAEKVQREHGVDVFVRAGGVAPAYATAERIHDDLAVALYAAAHTVDPRFVTRQDMGLDEVRKMLVAAIAIGMKLAQDAAKPSLPENRHIVFVGEFEEFYSIDAAEERLEELLDSGHHAPTLVNAALDRPGGEVLAVRAVKHITTAVAGEIR